TLVVRTEEKPDISPEVSPPERRIVIGASAPIHPPRRSGGPPGCLHPGRTVGFAKGLAFFGARPPCGPTRLKTTRGALPAGHAGHATDLINLSVLKFDRWSQIVRFASRCSVRRAFRVTLQCPA